MRSLNAIPAQFLAHAQTFDRGVVSVMMANNPRNGSSWSLAGKSSSYSNDVADPFKAIYSVRKEKIQGIYQTEGMACSVLVKIGDRDVASFVSWSGVMIKGDFNKPAQMNRFSEKNFGKYSLQVDSNSTVKTYGPFSFLEVGPIINSSDETSKWNNLMFILGFEALEKEKLTSNLKAYCFVGSEKLPLKLEFQRDTQLHKLVTSEEDRQKLEWPALLGAPIIVENQKVKSSSDIARFSVVGIVGLSEEGEPCPYFVTNKIFEQEASVHSPNEAIKRDDTSGQPDEKATGNPSGEQEVDAPGQPDEKATGNPSGEQEVDAPGRLTQVPIQKAFDQLGQPDEKATGNPSGEQEVDAPGMLCEVPIQESTMRRKAGSPSEKELLNLAAELGTKWKNLIRSFGFLEAPIDGIIEENPKLIDRAYKALLLWKDSFGGKATYEALERGLCHRTVHAKNLAEKYCYDH